MIIQCPVCKSYYDVSLYIENNRKSYKFKCDICKSIWNLSSYITNNLLIENNHKNIFFPIISIKRKKNMPLVKNLISLFSIILTIFFFFKLTSFKTVLMFDNWNAFYLLKKINKNDSENEILKEKFLKIRDVESRILRINKNSYIIKVTGEILNFSCFNTITYKDIKFLIVEDKNSSIDSLSADIKAIIRNENKILNTFKCLPRKNDREYFPKTKNSFCIFSPEFKINDVINVKNIRVLIKI